MASDTQNVASAERSAVVALDANCSSYALSVTTANATLELPKGYYAVWLLSGNPAVSVFIKNGAEPTAPTNGGGAQAAVYGFPGGGVERIRLAATTTINVKATASDTLYLTLLP